MSTIAAPAATAGQTPRSDLGAGQVFLNDSRLALTALNQLRYFALARLFGVPREGANLLTAVIALSAAGATYEGARRVLHTPIGFDRTDAAMGGLVLREAAYGIAGPAARQVPLAGALLTAAIVGGVAIPALRRAGHRVRTAEQRIREQRVRVYNAMGRPAPTA